MGCLCLKNRDTNRDEITINDIPKDKIVHKNVPENIKSFLKEKNQELVKLELLVGYSIYGESFIMDAKSLSDNSPIRYMYRQFKSIRDFEWECCISRKWVKGSCPKNYIWRYHKANFLIQEFIENSINLKPLEYPPESLKQTGAYLQKFHYFSPKIKAPDSYQFFGSVKANALRIIGKFPILSRFKRTIEGVDQIIKIFEENSEKCLCHNDFGYRANTLWDKNRPWIIDFEFFYMFYKNFDIGAFISLLIMTEEDRELFLKGYYKGKRTEKGEALANGRNIGLYKYSMFAVSLIGEILEDVDDKFFDNILELNKRRTDKAKFEKGESNIIRGNIKIAYMMLKHAELNMQTEKCKNAMKILGK